MTVPTAIASALTSLQTDMTAAAPIARTPFSTLIALQGQAVSLADAIDAATIADDATLDNPPIAGIGPQLVASFQTVAAAGFDESALVDIRGFVGRIATNLLEANS